jgi:hypothetical protein
MVKLQLEQFLGARARAVLERLYPRLYLSLELSRYYAHSRSYRLRLLFPGELHEYLPLEHCELQSDTV